MLKNRTLVMVFLALCASMLATTFLTQDSHALNKEYWYIGHGNEVIVYIDDHDPKWNGKCDYTANVFAWTFNYSTGMYDPSSVGTDGSNQKEKDIPWSDSQGCDVVSDTVKLGVGTDGKKYASAAYTFTRISPGPKAGKNLLTFTTPLGQHFENVDRDSTAVNNDMKDEYTVQRNEEFWGNASGKRTTSNFSFPSVGWEKVSFISCLEDPGQSYLDSNRSSSSIWYTSSYYYQDGGIQLTFYGEDDKVISTQTDNYHRLHSFWSSSMDSFTSITYNGGSTGAFSCPGVLGTLMRTTSGLNSKTSMSYSTGVNFFSGDNKIATYEDSIFRIVDGRFNSTDGWWKNFKDSASIFFSSFDSKVRDICSMKDSPSGCLMVNMNFDENTADATDIKFSMPNATCPQFPEDSGADGSVCILEATNPQKAGLQYKLSGSNKNKFGVEISDQQDVITVRTISSNTTGSAYTATLKIYPDTLTESQAKSASLYYEVQLSQNFGAEKGTIFELTPEHFDNKNPLSSKGTFYIKMLGGNDATDEDKNAITFTMEEGKYQGSTIVYSEAGSDFWARPAFVKLDKKKMEFHIWMDENPEEGNVVRVGRMKISLRGQETYFTFTQETAMTPDFNDFTAEYQEIAGVNDGGGDADTSCFNGGGALGWIICPVLTGLGEFIGGVYQKIVEPFLNVDATLLSDSAGSGTYKAWQTFQVFANIAFIIFFLVIIFSQITGVGIDNYGIKKALPKLIIAAILINLSYFICQLAVDISNVLGYGLRQILDGLSGSVGVNIEGATGVYTVSGSATALTVLAGALLAVLGVAAIMSSGWAILLPLLLGLLSAAISLMFVFVLLGVRQAGVVLLVVISPLAIVCYMLPNTKKLFDRWLKMFSGLLLLFPLCGLLIGGGSLASTILLTANPSSFWTALVAMLINIVPFFFLPTLLKGSFAAMGNIGAKISGMGSSLSKGFKAKAKDSNLYKDSYARAAAGKQGGLRERIANKTGLGRRGMARNRAAYLKQERERNSAMSLTGAGYAAAIASQKDALEKERVDDEMINMKEDTGHYDDNQMADQLQALLRREDGDLTEQEKLRRKALMKKMATRSGFAQKRLAETVGADGVTASSRAEAARIMTADSDVAKAIAQKDGYTAQYLRDIHSSDPNDPSKRRTEAATLADWKNEVGGDRKGMTNQQFVNNDVMNDDNDFMRQSDGVIKRNIGSLSDERLSRILGNDSLSNSLTDDAKTALNDEVARRNASGANIAPTLSASQQAQMDAQAAQRAQQEASFYVQHRSLAQQQGADQSGQHATPTGWTQDPTDSRYFINPNDPSGKRYDRQKNDFV